MSSRCKGFHLLNHCKQLNKPSNIDIKYTYDKSRYRNEWNCLMTFEHENQKHSYNNNSFSKRNGLYELINEIEPVIRKMI